MDKCDRQIFHNFCLPQPLIPDLYELYPIRNLESNPNGEVDGVFFYSLILGSSLGLSSSSIWWSHLPLFSFASILAIWREYWEDWRQKLDIGQSEGLLQPQQNKPEILPSGEG